MSEAIKEYLNQFYENANNIEEYKINLLKNHYYPVVKNILECSFNEFKIGVTKNKNILWFTSSCNLNRELIYYTTKDEYYLRFNKNSKDLIKVSLDDYNKTENNKTENKFLTRNFEKLFKCFLQ